MLKDGKVIAQGEPQKVLTEETVNKVYGVKPFIIEGWTAAGLISCL